MIPTISLFSGIGGLDLGAHFAGFSSGLAIDLDENALSCTRKALKPNSLCADISTLSFDDVINAMGGQKLEDTLLIGGPPCTAFSHAGFWIEKKRNGEDFQVGRVADFLRFIQELRPVAFLMENVPGLLFKNYSHIFTTIINETKSLDYKVSYQILNAADYGVPQRRRRLFVVGVRGSLRPFMFPLPRFSDESYRSSSWAFSGLTMTNNPPECDETLSGKYSDLLQEIPAGDNYLYLTGHRGHPSPRFEWRRKYWSFLLKLHPNKPSSTLSSVRVTNNGPFHWENRRLRLREIARLQTFPDNYPLCPNPLARRHLGNAVPPLLAAQIFLLLREQLGLGVARERVATLEEALSPHSTYVDLDNVLSLAMSG
ncbi:MAG TPA: DNA cytosine methyltransferase [Thermoanaerobaculia bacterium]|jgi:DNA (cytosine-5)-methyltransferase 1|nr:DNA cytosine methyltransferase [Thermoanaerobaculia bacterium]